MNLLWQSTGLTGILLVLAAGAAGAEAESEHRSQRAIAEAPRGRVINLQESSEETGSPLNQTEQPATTVDAWLAQMEAVIVQITGVRVEATEVGLQVVLETTAGNLPEPATMTSGNALILEIPNAALALPGGNELLEFEPVEGIALVQVTQLADNRVEVAITGTDAIPSADIAAGAGGLTLSVIPGLAQAVEEEEAIQVIVTGEEDAGYAVNDATTATRTNTPLRDIPQSIQVIPQQVIEDQQVTELRDALRNFSGVQQGNTVAGTSEFPIIRGFQQFNFFRDGFRETLNTRRDVANIEQIELLRGPASVLFGTLEPGGIVNLVTKKPLSEPFYEASLRGGNLGFFRPTIDLSGPVNSEETVLYRLNAAYERSDGFRDFDQGIERAFIAPVIALELGDRTDLSFDFEYLSDERPWDRGLVALGEEVADIPLDRVLGELDDRAATDALLVGYRLEHRFNEDWTLRNRFRFSFNERSVQNAEPGSLNEETGVLTRVWEDSESEATIYELQTNLLGSFTTGSIRHNLLIGIDLLRDTFDFTNRSGDAPSINIFEPVYGFSRPARDELSGAFIFETETDSLGIYLQDQITLLDNLKLLLGGRLDIVDGSTVSGDDIETTRSQQQDEAFSPRVGIVYQPIEPLSLYASFSQSFAPNSGVQSDGSPLEPERSTQYEVGVRGEFFDDRLIANLAVYEITKRNVATTDPDDTNFSIPVGEQRSRGIELDVIGEILPGWDVVASYAYTDAEITEDNDLPAGNQLTGVPFHAASLWTSYEIQQGNLQGLGFGVGLFYSGERQGDLANSFEVSDYLRTDAALFYRRDNWRAAINVRNLFDVDYIEATQRRNRINPGAPLTVIGSFSIEF
ncbi:MAG: TonB-dependent siderophore receptor [Leptolyngbyaceae cyanobacterium]